MNWTDAIPFFPKSELECHGTGTVKLDIHLAVHLPLLRLKWGKPLYATSVSRTPEHNRAINNGKGGHPNSMHLTENPRWPTDGAMAADLAWRNWPKWEKLRFAKLAWSLGWAVGLHDGFCHVDRRVDIGLGQAVFIYGEWSGDFDPDDVMQ